MGDYNVLKPDRRFVEEITRSGGKDVKKCFQCGTCSVVCELAPDGDPFPRKEMIWSQWGLKDRLVADPDIWLCHRCQECSIRCPRGARPADVLAAIRQQSVIHYAVPRFLGRWINQPKYLPILIFIPAVLLGLAHVAIKPIENALGISKDMGGEIVFASTTMFPHWFLNSFFTFFSVLALLAVMAGVVRFWRAMKAADAQDGNVIPVKSLGQSIVSTLKSIMTHDDFPVCETKPLQSLSHFGVFYGFIALFVVAIWVVTLRYNPLIQGDFIYPLSFWSPWKILANVGGVALVGGCLLMIQDRLKDGEDGGHSTFFDWTFIGTLLAVTVTGLATEMLHYARVEPLRYIVYYVHLVFVFMLLIYLPYSKFAHMFYRATAMVYAEYSGRTDARSLKTDISRNQSDVK